MTYYYCDIETAPKEDFQEDADAGLNPFKSKLITLQYQKLDEKTALPREELKILKVWDPGWSERMIVEHMYNLYCNQNIWNFVPIGNNLNFELKFLEYKMHEYFQIDGIKVWDHPKIDVKDVMILINDARFRGYAELLGKHKVAANMASWFKRKQWFTIEDYIQNEAKGFLEVLSVLFEKLPILKHDILAIKRDKITVDQPEVPPTCIDVQF